MEDIKDYKILKKVAETRSSLVYRGRKEGETDTVIIKVLKARHPSPSGIARFKQEYELIKTFNLDGVIKTFDVIDYQGSVALVLEDFGGSSLKQVLKRERLDTKSFLEIGVKLSETLGSLHKLDIVHKDIKPQNILLKPSTREVKITNFGIASTLTKENDEVYNREVIEGTLAYISPEQTGRMNRAVDYRTDLYSLGVTFYEMLTGSVPFMSQDPMEVIHSHIAISPVPPIEKNPEIPEIVSAITMKLLLKTAEERYQNAFGVMADLKECLRVLEEKGGIEPFELAQRDISKRFTIPQKLYGREQEREILMRAFEKVCGGTRGIMLVAGRPGIGKSALLNELHKPIVAKRGYFISGKYERFRRDLPYSSIVQALQGLVRQILSESEDKIGLWREDLLTALGSNGRVITDIIPDVKLIIGEQPEIPSLGPEESRNRFNLVFEKFVSVFPKEDHPVALFLDDLQWADFASLQMIRNLITSPEINHFFIMGAYRDNEVPDTHPLLDTLREIRNQNVAIDTITLVPLALVDVNHLVVDLLKCSDDRATMLAELVFKKTGGNPFFVNQFLKILYDERLIELHPEAGWQWDPERIREMRVTDNLVDLLVNKINRLSQGAREALKNSSCIGNRFDLESLSYLLDRSIDETLQDVTEAMREGLIDVSGNMYFYHHDRIHEAAYSLIPDEEKAKFHYRVGRLALEKTDAQDLKDRLFYVVDQLNAGSPCITNEKEREELAGLNLEAGKKAKASAAYSPALRYLETARGLLQKNCWETQYDLALAIYTEATEAAYLNGDYDLMNSLADVGIEHVRTAADKTMILRSKINACSAQQDFDGALHLGLDALEMLGVNLPREPDRSVMVAEFQKATQALSGKTDEDLVNQPEMTDPDMLSAIKILPELTVTAFVSAPDMHPLLVLKHLNIYLEHGNHPLAARAYVDFGIILSAGLNDIEGGYRFGNLAFKIIDKYNSRDQIADIMYVYNLLIRHWKEHIKTTIGPGLETYRAGIETGRLESAAFGLLIHDSYSIGIDTNLFELERDMAKHYKIISQLKQRHLLNSLSVWWQYVLNLLGQSDAPTLLVGKALDEEAIEKELIDAKNISILCGLYSAKTRLLFLFEEYSQALEYLRKAEALKESVKAITTGIYINYFGSMVKLAMYQDASRDEQSRLMQDVAENQRALERWAKHAPMNFLHRFHLVEAEKARVLGDVLRAEDNYDQAISLSKQNEYIMDEGIASQLAAAFYLSRGKERIAAVYMEGAHDCFSRWGAIAKVKQLEEKYPELLKTRPGKDSSGAFMPVPTPGSTADALDISTVTKASQTISGEIVLGSLLVKMMRIVMENAGAEKGFVILEENGKLRVEAEGTIGKEEISVLKSIPIEEHQGLSASIVNYVARTKKMLILNNAAKEGDFTDDPYVTVNQPKSILCAAILNQGRLTGILYLENNLSTGAFTPKRLEVLNVLSSQVAISIDNARLYEHLEDKVKERTQELNTTLKKVEEANNHIMESIRYAKLIQGSLLPDLAQVKAWLPESFFLWEPRDIIGGDFFYTDRFEDGSYIVSVADCTGHGVPGAFMTMIAASGLRRVIRDEGCRSPAAILKRLNKIVKSSLQQDTAHAHSDDGLDAAICFVDTRRHVLTFSGAKLPLMYTHDGQLTVIKGNKESLGYTSSDLDFDFSEHRVPLGDGLRFYLSTDGFFDQLGGDKRRRFSQKRFHELLVENSQKPFETQQEILRETLNAYRGENERQDDVTVVGFRPIIR